MSSGIDLDSWPNEYMVANCHARRVKDDTIEVKINMIDVDTLVKAFFNASELDINDGSAYNIGSGKLVSFLELIEVFTSFAGYKPTIKPLLDKPVGVHSRYCDMSLVKEKFGWEAKISLEEGMRRVYEAARLKI